MLTMEGSPVFEYVDEAYNTRLNTAIETNDKQLLLTALKSGVSVRLTNNNGWTPLHLAAKFDRTEFMEFMLKKEPKSINVKTHSGQTPLAICCEMNNYNTLYFLLGQKYINVNSVDNEIASALHIACKKGHFKIVKVLIDYGASLNEKDIGGFTPLHEGVVNNNYEICQYLLSHGADPLIKDCDYGLYPFHYACQNGNLSIVNLLLDNMQGFSINTAGADGRTALMLSIGSKNVMVIEELLKRDADANIADEKHITAIHIASSVGCFEIFKIIYQHTSVETIYKYCTLDSVPENGVKNSKANSLITLAIAVKDFYFLQNILNLNLDQSVLNCPFIEGTVVYSPISFLLGKYDFNEDTKNVLNLLIEFGLSLAPTFRGENLNWLDPLTACFISWDDTKQLFAMECIRILLQQRTIIHTLNQSKLLHFDLAVCLSKELVFLLLQHTDVVEPIDVLYCWFNKSLKPNRGRGGNLTIAKEIDCKILDLVPLRSRRMRVLCENLPVATCFHKKYRQVSSLASNCRYVIRKHLHEVTINNPSLFREKLKSLPLPKTLLDFMNYQ